MRLLSFLQYVENALCADGQDVTPDKVTRHVNYEAGLARMVLADGVSLVVQNYDLPDGQLCLKAWWQDESSEQIGLQSFFGANGHDWKAAARKVAACKPGEPLLASEESTETSSGIDPLDAADLIGGFRSAV